VKRFASFSFILVAVVLTALTASPSFAAASFCWSDSYGRGVGTVPRSCPQGQEMVGLFCYDACPKSDFYGGPGMKRAGIDCHSICPTGMDDQGLFCRASETGRGSGYPWKVGDALNLSGALSRCEAKEGNGKCEKWGAVIYPKCKEGYSNFFCCICRPAIPDCQRLGLSKVGQVDLSCAKAIKIASPPRLGVCGPGQEMDAGLCYDKCRSGYYGVGPVCWRQSPWTWVKCGMGAAAHNENDIVDECTTVIGNQVVAVGQLALSVATLGASMVATKASASSTNAGAFATLKKKYDEMVSLYETLKRNPATKLQAAEDAYPIGSKVWGVKTAANTALDIFSEADIARLAAQIAAIADPSGVAGAAAAFSYDKCSKRFPEEKYPEQYAQWVRLRTERFTNKLVVATNYPFENFTRFGSNIGPESEKSQEVLRAESWRVEPQGDGTVLLKSAIRGPGMCLGIIPDGAAQNQAQVQPCSDDSSGQPWKGQHWKFVQDGDWMQLKTLFSGDDKCLGTISTLAAPGAAVQYWPLLQPCGADPRYPNTVPGQHWKIAPSPYKGAGDGGWTP
jgi:hypothetical protein